MMIWIEITVILPMMTSTPIKNRYQLRVIQFKGVEVAKKQSGNLLANPMEMEIIILPSSQPLTKS
jgi:hypothetical protein